MSILPARYEDVLDEAVSRLISRADDSRGLTRELLKPRVVKVVEKYLFRDSADTDKATIRAFVEEIRADDLCLIIACENGNQKAWEDLVTHFDATVKSAARKMSANAEDAEDLAGSIWAELYGLRTDADGNKKSKLAYYSGRGSLAGWLRAVVSQLAIDEFRKQSKFVQIEENREFENLAEEASHNSNHSVFVHQTNNPEELLTEKQTANDVSKALQTATEMLGDEDRLILKLYYFDDLKLKDIAATFGYHEATASRKLVRVQNEIRKGVEKELKKSHGWTDLEVKKYLSNAASKLSLSIEKMIAVWAVVWLLQDFWT